MSMSSLGKSSQSKQEAYNKVYYHLSHNLVTWDVDCDISTAYC